MVGKYLEFCMFVVFVIKFVIFYKIYCVDVECCWIVGNIKKQFYDKKK